MERENTTNHQGGQRVNARELLRLSHERPALRPVESPAESPGSEVALDDLSVSGELKRTLLRSCWAAVVEIAFRDPSLDRHPGVYTLLGSHLKNRTAVIEYGEGSIRVDFQVEDGTEATRDKVVAFGSQIRELLGRDHVSVETRINALDPSLMEDILGKEKPNLRAL